MLSKPHQLWEISTEPQIMCATGTAIVCSREKTHLSTLKVRAGRGPMLNMSLWAAAVSLGCCIYTDTACLSGLLRFVIWTELCSYTNQGPDGRVASVLALGTTGQMNPESRVFKEEISNSDSQAASKSVPPGRALAF
ncbi:hypothetical protein CDAR_253601 [Caerostris darwini]|uniref:Uncharacterized protein n=1 Tax=Caerostris darwini TaxID=1538125 RepID=A0AAV4Q786_9ARAC|nr:hypothetical protein CDAR_253601 [Caerostris darwini]